MSGPTTTDAINKGTVFWQVADDEGGLSEPALLVHVDSGDTLIVEQNGALITLNRNGKNLRALGRLLLSKAEEQG